MLQDKDRIFTNLYGDFGRDIVSAKSRGDWKDTAALIAKGKDWIINEVKVSELRGRGGAGLIRSRRVPARSAGWHPGVLRDWRHH